MQTTYTRTDRPNVSPGSAFGEVLIEVLAARNLTFNRAAERLCIDRSMLSRFNNGSRRPSLDFLGRMARDLDLTSEETQRLIATSGVIPNELKALLIRASREGDWV